MYYLYHIPGKKIGVTRNLNNRVTLIQGYKENEYEVLFTSDDIDFISQKEIELQKSYGYKVDRKLYKQLFNKMKINATEQTSTFPCPINKLKGQLMDNIGMKWQTDLGQFEITNENIKWIMSNVKTSMFNPDRSYIYNKAFYEAFYNVSHTPDAVVEEERFDLIRSWAAERGIYDSGSSGVQYLKLIEETGELAQGLLNKDKAEIKDAIGDIVVVLTSIAKFEDMLIEDCIDSAYAEISNRKGKMIDGTFVKETL